MIVVIALAICVFGVAMTIMAIGIIVKGRPLRRSCCGGQHAAGGGAADSSCPTCRDRGDRQPLVQISAENLKRT